jgi:hypothetical protein
MSETTYIVRHGRVLPITLVVVGDTTITITAGDTAADAELSAACGTHYASRDEALRAVDGLAYLGTHYASRDEAEAATEEAEVAEVLDSHGPRFAGSDAAEHAVDWIDWGFDAVSMVPWCEIGVWDAGVAAIWRDAGLTPEQVLAAASDLAEDDDDLIYAICNSDKSPDIIIDACA